MPKNTENTRKRSKAGDAKGKDWDSLGGAPDGVKKVDAGNKARPDNMGASQDSPGNIHRDKSAHSEDWREKGGAPDDIKQVDPRSSQKSKDYKNNE